MRTRVLDAASGYDKRITMALRFLKSTYKKSKAYTLAEVLIVMTIIMLIMLALPPITKKVFKIKDTRSPHGRYECYWATDAGGNKRLHSYLYTDSGIEEDKDLGAGATYCEFKPSKNSIYFIMHAVGGGGAGAMIADVDVSNGDGTKTQVNLADLEPKQQHVQATSYLSGGVPIVWTPWVTWMNKNYKKSDLPWADSTNTATGMKSQFDVGSVETKQLLRYRVSGTAGRSVSTFFPQIPGEATLRITPGKGGELKKDHYGSGGPGGDTTIEYLYKGKAPIEALLAKGGKGGNGAVDSKITYTLVGGPSTDFELSGMASIEPKESGFKDVIEDVDGYEMMTTKVPSNAGDSGAGETQYVVDTNGEIYYEYGRFQKVLQNSRRVGLNWENITFKVLQAYFKRPNFTTTPNCEKKSITTPLVMSRDGYCDMDDSKITSTTFTFVCGVGNIPESNLTNLSHSQNPGKSGSWYKFIVTLPYTYNAGLKKWNYGTPVVKWHDGTSELKNVPTAYNATNAKFYDCKFDSNYFNMTCKTVVSSGDMYVCKKKGSDKCKSGQTAKARNKTSKAYSGTDDMKMKCPATSGGDGAVVILW